ncbi:MAG: hypothetical protein H6524_04410 [Actinobacteria bacterium]|nr:hypothetical protein [Actinomycetota bacterium]MCO5301456.1 hypothetical protein [Candidatus Nanopelagicales bacterium]
MTVHEAAPPGTLADLLQQLEHLDDEDLPRRWATSKPTCARCMRGGRR